MDLSSAHSQCTPCQLIRVVTTEEDQKDLRLFRLSDPPLSTQMKNSHLSIKIICISLLINMMYSAFNPTVCAINAKQR